MSSFNSRLDALGELIAWIALIYLIGCIFGAGFKDAGKSARRKD